MPPIARAGRSATRFTREFMATLVAVVSTAIGVVAILALGRLANRLDAQPIQFAYPAKKEEDH